MDLSVLKMDESVMGLTILQCVIKNKMFILCELNLYIYFICYVCLIMFLKKPS